MTFHLKLSQLISMQGRWTMLGQHSPFSFMHLCFRIRQPVISLLNTAGSPNNWRLRDQPIHGHLSWDTVIHIQSQPEGFIANSYLLQIKQHENRLQLWLGKFSFDLHHLPPSYIYLLAFIAWLVAAITYSSREWNISVKQDPSVRAGGWMRICFCFFSTTHKLHFTLNLLYFNAYIPHLFQCMECERCWANILLSPSSTFLLV